VRKIKTKSFLFLLATLFFGIAFYFSHLSKTNTLHVESIEERSASLTRYTKENPDDVSAQIALAETYLNQNKKELAIDLLEQTIDTFPNNTDVLWLLTISYYENKNYANSIQVAEELLKYNNYQYNVLFHLANLHFLTGNNSEFVNYFKEGLAAHELLETSDHNQEYTENLTKFIQTYEELKDHERVVDSYLSIAQNNFFDYNMRQYAYEQISIINETKLSKEDLIDKGIIELHFDEYDSALKIFNRVIASEKGSDYAEFLIIDTLSRSDVLSKEHATNFDEDVIVFSDILIKLSDEDTAISRVDFNSLSKIYQGRDGDEKQLLSLYLMNMAEMLGLDNEYNYYSTVFFSGEFDELYLLSLY